MGRVAAIVVAVLAGCGRISFDASVATDAAVDDAASEPGVHRWSLVQTMARTASPLPIAASGAGNLIVVAAHFGSQGTAQSVVDDAGNTYTAIPAARAIEANPPDGLDLWFAANTKPGATSIAVEPAVQVVSVVVWEFAGIRTVNPLDTAAALDDQPASTTPLGPMIATQVPGELVISVAIVANGVTGIHTGNEFTNDHRSRGNGYAHITDPAAPAGTHRAQWDQGTAGTFCANAAAFFPAPM